MDTPYIISLVVLGFIAGGACAYFWLQSAIAESKKIAAEAKLEALTAEHFVEERVAKAVAGVEAKYAAVKAKVNSKAKQVKSVF